MASDTAPLGPQYEFRPTSIRGSTRAESAHDLNFEFNGAIPMSVDYRPKNVVLFGQTGVGKSSLVNLLAGCDIAKTSPRLQACTLDAQAYSFTFPGPTNVNLFDTVGLLKPEIGVNSFFGAITKAHHLIKSLHKYGGIDLLVFCIHGGRITSTTQQNYHLFFDFLCARQVPVAIVVTNLEQEDRMEDWWDRNEATLDRYAIRSVAHACVTALPCEVLSYANKRADSKKALRTMLLAALSYTDTRSRIEASIGGLGSLLLALTSGRKSVEEDIATRTEKECGLRREDAHKLAHMLVDAGVFPVRRAGVEKFAVSGFAGYRAVCTHLEVIGRLSEAIETFRQMQNVLRDTDTSAEINWEHDFRERCIEELAKLGDTTRHSKKHAEAIRYYSDAISLDPSNLNDNLLRRCNELIMPNPTSKESFEALKAMLSMFERSCYSKIRELRHQYIDATSAIRKEVEEAVRRLPTVLIDTESGRLHDKTQQAAAFEELPIYDELRSSMTTTLDGSRIRTEVTRFYRYVMFSHKWQPGEPTFQLVENNSVYSLPSSLTFDKLRNFCKLVVALQFKWAWSDTCCVNQLDRGAQQESIVAMFRWYQHSSLTVVHLLGVLSKLQKAGCLWKSIWNTRGWTYQEYVASRVVRFYTEDWKPYLGLEIFNHKESPAVLTEMELATNVTAQQLVILQPGLDRAREKLYLASRRQTTHEEDMACSLFGIFGVALPVIYGERNMAVGRLLEHILMRSDEVTLLAWTGPLGSFHSYLPASLGVYNEIVSPHVPAAIEMSRMDCMLLELHYDPSILDLSLVVDLYNSLFHLPPLSLVAGRLKLPGILFQLSLIGHPSNSGPDSCIYVYHMTAPLLGDIRIETTADLSSLGGLCLIHPWIRPLIDLDFSCGKARFDLRRRAVRLLVRLRQPFGGLLFAPSGGSQYRRVATDSLIMVQIQMEASLSELIEAVQTVEIQ